MRIGRALMLIAGLVLAISPAAADRLECGAERVLSVAADEPAVIESAAGELVIRELGLDVRFRVGDGAERGVDLRPPRSGEAWFPLTAPSVVSLTPVLKGASTTVRVRLLCDADSQETGRCLRGVETALAARDLAALAALPPAPALCRAFATHARAQVLGGMTAHSRAHAEYRSAKQQWLQLGESARAAAADLGAAEQALNAGDLNIAAEDALLAVESNRKVNQDYFSNRAKVTLGVAFRRMGKLQEALQVQLEALRYFESTAEGSEVANVHFNLAAAALYRADLAELDRHLAAIRSLDRAQWTPVVQARVDALEGLRALAEGRTSKGLRMLSEALGKAESAAALPVAVAIRRNLIDAYRGLGLIDEAYGMVATALRLNAAAEAPARTAQLLAALGQLDLESGQSGASMRWTTAAARIYVLLNMPMERQSALTQAWRAQRIRGHSVDEPTEQVALAEPSCWIAAEQALGGNAAKVALKALDQPSCTPRSLDELLDATRLRALALAGSDSPRRGADFLLEQAIVLRQRLAQGTAGLRYAALRQLSRLTDTWLQLQDAAPEARSELPARALTWALLTHPLQALDQPPSSAHPASPALGLALLAPESAREYGDVVGREVLARLTAAADAGAEQVLGTPTLAAVQAALDVDTWLLIPLGSRSSTLQLWISRDRAWAVPLDSGAAVERAIGELESSLDGPSASIARVESSAKSLSDLLFSAAPMGAAPRKLWLLADERLGAVPLSMLTWPSTQRPLLETTTISWITALGPAPAPASHAAAAATVFVASQTSKPTPQLAPLYNAVREPELLALGATGLRPQRLEDAEATPERLIQALQENGALVHVAAHGIHAPGFLGYSGVWLNQASGEPAFLSWLDVADTALSAELLVLNACQLAAGPGVRRRATLSFAASLSTAGVDNVIAASTPLSDTAATVWVPAFYRALDLRDLDSSAEALRQAQLALRQSRHFRHPYYWASLAHFRRLTISSQAL